MKKALIILICIVLTTIIISACKSSKIDEPKSQIADLSEELSGQNASQEYEETDSNKTIEETKQSSTEECQLTFDENNIHEISQQFQDEGYPYFSLSYPDNWAVDEHYEMGYSVNFFSPLSSAFGTNSGGTVDMPKFGMSIYILSDEISSMDNRTVADEFFSWWRNEVSVTEPDIYPEDPIYSYVIGDSEGNEWYLNYEFFKAGNDTFVFEVFGTGPEYEACMDYLVYSYLWDDERLYVEADETEEEIEEEKPKVQASAPTVSLSIIEGPTMADNICYYRIKADVTGSPYPDIFFDRDDSNGAWGSNIAQVNIYSEDESVTLTATATNSAGSATESITVSGCGGGIKEEESEEEEEDSIKCPQIVGWSIRRGDDAAEDIGNRVDVFAGIEYRFIVNFNANLPFTGFEEMGCSIPTANWSVTDGIITLEYFDMPDRNIPSIDGETGEWYMCISEGMQCGHSGVGIYWEAPDFSGDVEISVVVKITKEGTTYCTLKDTITVHVIHIFKD